MTDVGRVFVVAVLGVLAMGVSSCGEDAPPTTPQPVADAQPPEPPPLPEPPAWPSLSKEQHDAAKRLGVPVRFENDLGMRFVLIPAGTFLMGSPEDEEGRLEDEGPQHEVTISEPFYMSIWEVTNGQYRRYRPQHDSGDVPPIRGLQAQLSRNADEQPVTGLLEPDAREFAAWLLKQDPVGRRYFLPSEAQWEYACRAGTTSRFWWGDSEADAHKYENLNDPVTKAWLDTSRVAHQGKEPFPRDDGHRVAAPVGSYLPSPWGLYDMLGNVAEWTSDRHGPYPAEPQTDPFLWRGEKIMFRGGTWMTGPRHSRCATRGHPKPTWTDWGLRLVSPVPEEGE